MLEQQEANAVQDALKSARSRSLEAEIRSQSGDGGKAEEARAGAQGRGKRKAGKPHPQRRALRAAVIEEGKCYVNTLPLAE